MDQPPSIIESPPPKAVVPPTDDASGESSPKDYSTLPRNKSPKSASARFRSFLGKDKEKEDKASSSSTGSLTSVSTTTSPTTSPTSSRAHVKHSLSSPNLLSFFTARNTEKQQHQQVLIPSKSPRLARSESLLPGIADSSPTTPPPIGNLISRITPTNKPKHNIPIYMYLEAECSPSSSSQSSTTDSPAHSAPVSPMSTPSQSPRSSPRPTRPSPLPPRRSPTHASPLHRDEHDDLLLPVINEESAIPTETSPFVPQVASPLDSPAPSRPVRSSISDPMLHQILASPLVGSTTFTTDEPSTPSSPLMGFTSPTVLRRPPPRTFNASTGGSTMLDKASKELTELPESTFTAASCVLTKLLLSRNQLTELPHTISYLTDLTQLDLSYNKFEKLPPVENMQKLKEATLQGNFLLQTETGLSGLASLVNLRKLELSSNQIGNSEATIPADVFYLTNLQELIISHNGLINLSADIAWLSELTIVDLSYNLIPELPADIGLLVNLKKLKLKSNKLTTIPDELASLVNLTELDLSQNEITSLPNSMAALYNLITLHLSHNCISEIPPAILGGGDPMEGEDGQMWVQGMFALRELRIRENLLTSLPEAISNLVDLQTLDLTCNNIESIPFSSLACNTKLEQLFLSGNKIQEVPEDICTFYSLDVLNLSDNLLTSLPENLWQLSSLRQLSISYNQISSLPLPPPDESWRSLEELFAAGNSNLKEIQKFGELSSLHDLYLQSCGFTEVPLLHSVSSLPYLEKLDLSNNSISHLPDEFFLLESLSRLALSHNQFTSLPSDLSTLRRVEYLDISHNKITVEPEAVKIMVASIGTEAVTSGNPYTFTLPKPDSANGKSAEFQISMADLVGRRPTMEDTFSICPNLGGVASREAFAIFDGHAGSIASHFVAKYLDRILNNIISTHPTESPLKWLELTMAKLVDLFRTKIQESKVSGAKHCGTTGLILMVDAEHYYVANVGDTRAVVSRGGKAMRISTDDKPSNPEEELRIRKLGGFVVVGSDISRVNGTLAVSRSIGDFYMHPYVTAEPHLHEFARDESDEFIILACDGVWDEVSDQRAVDIVRGQTDPTQAAFAVRDKAYVYGSDDNISVMLLTKPK